MPGRKAQRERATGARARRTLLIHVAFDVAAIGAVVFFSWRERHVLTGFASVLSRVTWYSVLLAFVAEMASIPPLAEAQRILLRAGGAHVNRRQINLVTLASNAVSMSVPVGVAVAEGYTYTQYSTRRHHGGGRMGRACLRRPRFRGLGRGGAHGKRDRRWSG